jgi:hypothetical protein
MMKDTDHVRIQLSPDIKLYTFHSDVTAYKGELSVWANLPDVDDGDDESPSVTLMIGKAWGRDDCFLALTPEQARDLARALEARATEVEEYDPEEETA